MFERIKGSFREDLISINNCIAQMILVENKNLNPRITNIIAYK